MDSIRPSRDVRTLSESSQAFRSAFITKNRMVAVIINSAMKIIAIKKYIVIILDFVLLYLKYKAVI